MEVLFKFSSAEGALSILKNLSVFVTSPLDLNDPFEMRPAWTSDHESCRHKDEIFRNSAVAGARFVVPTADGLIPGGIIPESASPPEMDVESMVGIADSFNQEVFMRLHEKYRVLSFVEALFPWGKRGGESDEQATLMWSHYADYFQGICLVLDPNQFPNGIQQGGYTVEYPTERPSIPSGYYSSFRSASQPSATTRGYVIDPESETGMEIPKEVAAQRLEGHILKLLTSKSPGWRYERERRMIYRIQDERSRASYRKILLACQSCRTQGKTYAECETKCMRDAIALPASAILGVIFGVDCLPHHVDQAFELLEEKGCEEVDTYWTAIHSVRYAVQYSPGDRKYINYIHTERARNTAVAKRHFRNEKWMLGPKGTNMDSDHF